MSYHIDGLRRSRERVRATADSLDRHLESVPQSYMIGSMMADEAQLVRQQCEGLAREYERLAQKATEAAQAVRSRVGR